MMVFPKFTLRRFTLLSTGALALAFCIFDLYTKTAPLPSWMSPWITHNALCVMLLRVVPFICVVIFWGVTAVMLVEGWLEFDRKTPRTAFEAVQKRRQWAPKDNADDNLAKPALEAK
jgi:hypothetical protein